MKWMHERRRAALAVTREKVKSRKNCRRRNISGESMEEANQL